MFFFMVFVAIGRPALEPEAFDMTIRERFYGEIVGIAVALIAISILLWWQKSRSGTGL